MNKFSVFCTSQAKTGWVMMAVLLVTTVSSAYGQKVEVAPLFGYRAGGTIKAQYETNATRAEGKVQDSVSYGFVTAYRFDSEDGCDKCDAVGFRWLRQSTDLKLGTFSPVVNPLTTFAPQPLTIAHYLGDFSREFPIDGKDNIRPFIVGTVGLARLGTSSGSSTRFAFGLGAGVKVFPKPHWGFRFQAEYLGALMQASAQKIVCTTGCLVVVNGGILNQFQVSFGPVFRF